MSTVDALGAGAFDIGAFDTGAFDTGAFGNNNGDPAEDIMFSEVGINGGKRTTGSGVSTQLTTRGWMISIGRMFALIGPRLGMPSDGSRLTPMLPVSRGDSILVYK
jgi:hypothetical protein